MKRMKNTILIILFAIAASTAMAQKTIQVEPIFHDIDPVPVNLKDIIHKIEYPQYALEHDIEGTVVFRVFVNKNGECHNHYTLNNVHPELVESVENQVRDLKFEPARKSGEPVAAWVSIPFKFEIRN